jgi:hypothetical protein
MTGAHDPSARSLGRSQRADGFWSDVRGANFAEYIVVVAVVAIGSLGAAEAFGLEVSTKIRCYAETVSNGEGTCSAPSRTATVAVDEEPNVVDPTDPVVQASPRPGPPAKRKDWRFEKIDGAPFVRGAADSIAVQPNDVAQGALGDCFILAPLAAVAARDPKMIERMVSRSLMGGYTVKFRKNVPPSRWQFWSDGVETEAVRVTGTFPARNGRPVFAQSGDSASAGRELWPMIIEKAFAKRRDSGEAGYDKIGKGGNPASVLTAITGVETTTWAADGLEFDTLYEDWRGGSAIVPYTKTSEKAKGNPLYRGTTTRMPLIAEHAYYVTGMDPKAKTITLQNPWGWREGGITMSWDDFTKGFEAAASNPLRKPKQPHP